MSTRAMRLALSIVLAASTLNSFTQNEVDALRYGNTNVIGSARSLGMGGAFGAVGADNTAFWNNPAGLAMNKRMSFELSLGIQNRGTSANHLGTTRDDADGRTVLQSLGLINVKNSEKNPRLRYNYGFGLANFSNYNQNITIEGNAVDNTFLNVFAAQADGVRPAELFDAFPAGAGLAWEAYLIDPLDTIQNTYIAAENRGRINQRKNIGRTGRHTETTFGLGVSIDEKLMIGMTIGFQSVFFRQTSTYIERFEESGYLREYIFNEDINASGNGINMRLGVIYRLGEKLRVGASWQSPTNIVISDAYSTSIASTFVDGAAFDIMSPEFISNFSVRVPARYSANAAFILGKAGLISADYETTNFGRLEMGSTGVDNDYDYANENLTIEAVYRRIHRVKTGVEFRIANDFRARAGIVYETSPFENGVAINDSRLINTIGGGFRRESFFVDLALMYSGQNRESYWLYDPSFISETELTNTWINVVISAGFRF